MMGMCHYAQPSTSFLNQQLQQLGEKMQEKKKKTQKMVAVFCMLTLGLCFSGHRL